MDITSVWCTDCDADVLVSPEKSDDKLCRALGCLLLVYFVCLYVSLYITKCQTWHLSTSNPSWLYMWGIIHLWRTVFMNFKCLICSYQIYLWCLLYFIYVVDFEFLAIRFVQNMSCVYLYFARRTLEAHSF